MSCRAWNAASPLGPRSNSDTLYFKQMSAITLELPDYLVERLRKHEERLPEILELGLRELHADIPDGFEGTTEVLEFLASLPSPQEILGLKPSERLRAEVLSLLEKSQAGTLCDEDERRW